MIQILLPASLAVLAGASIVVQQVLNANLRAALNSAAWAGLASYFVGLVCMAALIVGLRDPLPTLSATARLPWWAWTGGLFGAIYIGLAIVLVPRLGTAAFTAFLVAGQMIASLAIDQIGLPGLEQRSIDLPRLVGVAFLVGGVALIRR